MSNDRPTIVLLGAGHAHLGVIDDWLKHGPPHARTILVEPRDAMQYSGMVPGWMAGEYRGEETRIALDPLVRAARIDWRRCCAVGLDPVNREILLETGERIAFDLCSIAIGGAGRAEKLVGADPRLIDIRPIDAFMESWDRVEHPSPPRRVAVIGGGAGGVELAFGARNSDGRPDVVLIAGEHGLIPGHPTAARRIVKCELERQDITILTGEARFADGALMVGDKALEPFDAILAAVGSGAPSWPRASGLPVDEDGFIRVGPTQQVEDFPYILAAGDVARRTDTKVRHSGVHAVYAGPVLATNLRRLTEGRSDLATYSPFGRDFYLFNTCRGTSILSYGPFGLKARWLRRLKDWLDRRWIARFAQP